MGKDLKATTIQFRCTAAEKEEIERKALEAHKSISAYIIDAIFCQKDKKK